MPHVIPLRGAWQVATDGECTDHTRKFGQPRLQHPAEEVWLCCAHVPGLAQVYLNEQVLGEVTSPEQFQANVTARLLNRNTVRFSVRSTEPLGAVTIEIRAPL